MWQRASPKLSRKTLASLESKDVFTGYVKLYHLASDRSIFVTQDGLLGCYHGDFEEHWWKLLERDDKGSFSLAPWLIYGVVTLRQFSGALLARRAIV